MDKMKYACCSQLNLTVVWCLAFCGEEAMSSLLIIKLEA